MKIRPLHDRIVVKRIEETMTTRSVDCVYPRFLAKEKPQEGEVIAVGVTNGKRGESWQ